MKILYLLKTEGRRKKMNIITIAKKSGLSYPYCHRLISELQARGFVKTTKRRRDRFVKLIIQDFSELYRRW